MPENECFPDPEGMTDAEKISLIEQLHEANHAYIDNQHDLVDAVSGLAWTFLILAKEAEDGLKWWQFKARRTLRSLVTKLTVIGNVAFTQIGVTADDVNQATQFSDIIGDLADDPAFQVPEEE